jgi:hypothetical protein
MEMSVPTSTTDLIGTYVCELSSTLCVEVLEVTDDHLRSVPDTHVNGEKHYPEPTLVQVAVVLDGEHALEELPRQDHLQQRRQMIDP